MSILTWIVLGLVAGWLASMLMRGGGYGIIGDIILGLPQPLWLLAPKTPSTLLPVLWTVSFKRMTSLKSNNAFKTLTNSPLKSNKSSMTSNKVE
jgi:hypothetical protein